MIAARAHVELGQFGKAQTSATHAQALAPKLAAPRILKALALHGLGKPRRTMFQLHRALDHGHPPLSTDTSGLDGKNIWRPRHRPLKQYQQDFLYDHSHIDQPAHRHFANHTLDSQWTPTQRVRPTALEWVELCPAQDAIGHTAFKLSLSTDVYNEPRFNRSSLSINHKLVFTPAAQHQTTLTQAFTAVHQFNALESRIFSSSWSRRYALRDPQNPRQIALRDWSLGADIITRPDGKDSRVLKTRLRHYWPSSSSNQFNLGLGYTNRFSDAADVGNQEIKIDLGWRPIFQTSPYVLNFNFSLSFAKWKDLEITFPEKRRVRERKISVNLSNPNFSYLGLTPSAHYSFLDRDANIEMFRVRSHDMFIGLTNAF